MKKYLISFGTLATVTAFFLAINRAEIATLSFCLTASASFLAAAIFRPKNELSYLEAKFLLIVGLAGEDGITIEELNGKLKAVSSSYHPFNQELSAIAQRAQIAELIEIKDNKIFGKS